MNLNSSITLLLVLGVLLANAPFCYGRFLFLGPHKWQRPGFLLLELLLAYAIFLGLGWGLEGYFGQRQAQAWQFYAVSLCLFLTLGFPGFVARFLLKK